MTDDVANFLNHYLFDVKRTLLSSLEDLKDDLRSDEPAIRRRADKRASEIFDWLYPPLPELTNQGKIKVAREILDDEGVSEEIRLGLVGRLIRSGGRKRGRPRTETSQHAILALSQHYASSATWAEIALNVKGCAHAQPNKSSSCASCADAIRDACGRLESFLKTLGYDRSFLSKKRV
jgi:hypothetical protein